MIEPSVFSSIQRALTASEARCGNAGKSELDDEWGHIVRKAKSFGMVVGLAIIKSLPRALAVYVKY